MTDVYEFSEYERTNLIYNFSVMTPAEIYMAKAKLTAHEKEQAEKKAAAPKAPAAPVAAPSAAAPGVPGARKPLPPLSRPAAAPKTDPPPKPDSTS
jgi:hypothetical protein